MTPADTAAGSTLLLPDGWCIDWISIDRLERALAAAPPTVAGVGAAAGPLPPGGSYRTHAEWRALRRAQPEAVDGPFAGAVLVREEVEHEVDGGQVHVAGPLAVDRGAHVHDPLSDPAPIEVAHAEGRSPFPVRPIVLFLAVEGGGGETEWARRLVNDLLAEDVEARLAAAEVAEGAHLTRPCRPDPASVAALRPQVVVALDAGAAAVASPWCASDRRTVVVEVAPGLGEEPALVDWRIGRASGRLRARIGTSVGAATFAALVDRLCSGPHPVPPQREVPG
jgi:hypothetical protein